MTNPHTFSSSFINHKTGSLRTMFYNIYGYTWYPDRIGSPHLNTGPIALRQEMEAEVIKAYSPDILGLQEYCEDFRKGMSPRLREAGYTEVEVYHSAERPQQKRVNFTPLFYCNDRVKLIDKGFVMYPETMPDPSKDDGTVLNINDVSSKSITWAVFEERNSGKRFIVLCTHFMYSAPWLTKALQEMVRVQNARILLATVKEIHSNEQYKGLPVIVGGDLNCCCDSDSFGTLIEGGLEWLYEVAAVKSDSCGLKEYAIYDEQKGEYVSYSIPGDEPYKSIDYLLMMQGSENNQISVSAYVTVTDRNALLSSDHCPRFADFTLN